MSHLWPTTEGVFGVAPGYRPASSFFVLFGSLLETAGAGNHFIKSAIRCWASCGPPSAAVVASCEHGLILRPRSPTSSPHRHLPIPLMKRVGYAPKKAGGRGCGPGRWARHAAGHGRCGVLMVEYVGIPYTEVRKLWPALISTSRSSTWAPRGAQGRHPRTAAPGDEIRRTSPAVLRPHRVGPDLSLPGRSSLRHGLDQGAGRRRLGDHRRCSCSAATSACCGTRRGTLSCTWTTPAAPDRVRSRPARRQKTGLYYLLPVVALIWNLMVEEPRPRCRRSGRPCS